ncbi:MAG: hypothetical protein WAV40_05040 [Microgenomates group bacterium]
MTADNPLYPLTDNELEILQRRMVNRSAVDELVGRFTLEEIALYVKSLISSGDDPDEQAGPRTVDM